MDIQTKLVVALVAVALASMIALSAVMYVTAEGALSDARLGQMEALAESRKDAAQQIVQAWTDRVRLIASRTQLRQSLANFGGDVNSVEGVRISRIVNDAAGAVRIIRGIEVLDREGRSVAVSGERLFEGSALGVGRPADASGDVMLVGVGRTSDGSPRVDLKTPLRLEEEVIGSILLRLDASGLRGLERDRTGLGSTGQTLVFLADPVSEQGWLGLDGTRALNPALIDLALADSAAILVEDLQDDSGELIWLAARSLPEMGLGVIVKLDALEARETIVAFRERLFRIVVSLAAFPILLGVALGIIFARPILDLASVAERVRAGDLTARATVHAQDEVGLLARTFNEMCQELEQRVESLLDFERFFDVSLDMMGIAGTDGFFKRVNPAFQRVLGWDKEQLLEQSFMEFVHPDDVQSTHDEVEKLSKGIPTISFQNRYRTVSGEYKFLHWASYPDPATGLLYAIAREITDVERGQAEIEDLKRRLKAANARLRGHL